MPRRSPSQRRGVASCSVRMPYSGGVVGSSPVRSGRRRRSSGPRSRKGHRSSPSARGVRPDRGIPEAVLQEVWPAGHLHGELFLRPGPGPRLGQPVVPVQRESVVHREGQWHQPQQGRVHNPAIVVRERRATDRHGIQPVEEICRRARPRFPAGLRHHGHPRRAEPGAAPSRRAAPSSCRSSRRDSTRLETCSRRGSSEISLSPRFHRPILSHATTRYRSPGNRAFTRVTSPRPPSHDRRTSV